MATLSQVGRQGHLHVYIGPAPQALGIQAHDLLVKKFSTMQEYDCHMVITGKTRCSNNVFLATYNALKNSNVELCNVQ